MAAAIEFTCAAHERPSRDGLVTTVDGAWAYCAGGAQEGHVWRRIDAMPVELLRAGIAAAPPQAAQ
jgi:hypothetical protein